jgi:phytoene dehydrogenase-like protein
VSGPASAPRSDARPDAIVIGAGISGLVAATELAQRGHAVLVLEHGHQAGGLMAGMRRRGFHFDVGCQSFEDMGIVFPLLEGYGLSDLATFRRARYRLVMPGLDATVESIPQIRAEFQRAFPESAEALGRVFDVHQRTSDLIRRLFAPGRIPWVRDGGALALPRWALAALPPGPGGSLVAHLRDLRTLMFEDFARWYERELPPSTARDLLSVCGYSRMNVFVASAFWHLWAHDYWYPEGGLQAFFQRWVAALEARGVRFLFKRTVVEFDRRGRRVEAVITHRGERFEAGEVVYTGDWRQALTLVGRERFPPRQVERFDRVEHSDALVSVYLGLDLPPDALRERLGTSHVFYFPSAACRTTLADDEGAHRRAFLEVTAHGMFDPSLAPPGQSAVVLQAFTRHDWQGGWGTGLAGDPGREGRRPVRNAEYRRLKRRVAEDLLAVFEGLVPGAGKRVVFVDVGAPPSTVRFTRNAFGGSCGFALDWRDFPFASPLGNAATPLDNLHAAGHFTVWPGAVPTAALSGKIAARRAEARLRQRRHAHAAPRASSLDRAAPQQPRGPHDR